MFFFSWLSFIEASAFFGLSCKKGELFFESFELLLLQNKAFLNRPFIPSKLSSSYNPASSIVLSACANVIRNTTYLTQVKNHLFTYSSIAGGLASCLFSLPHPWFLCQTRLYTTILQKASKQDLVMCCFFVHWYDGEAGEGVPVRHALASLIWRATLSKSCLRAVAIFSCSPRVVIVLVFWWFRVFDL